MLTPSRWTETSNGQGWLGWLLVTLLTIVAFVGLLALSTVVLAEAEVTRDPLPSDVTAWFADIATLAFVIVSLVSLVRKHAWKNIDGAPVVMFSVLVGVVLGMAGVAWEVLELSYLGGVSFGAVSGLAASGGVGGVRTLFGIHQ